MKKWSGIVVKGKEHYSDGIVTISGFKHSLDLLISASIVINKKIIINNVPYIKDIEVFRDVFKKINGIFIYKKNKLFLDTRHLVYSDLTDSIISNIHGSIYLLPVMVCKFGKVNIIRSGGCQIGGMATKNKRPIEHILKTLSKFGIKYHVTGNLIKCVAEKVEGCIINLEEFTNHTSQISGPYISGVTKAAILMAISSKGNTKIYNYYKKDDVIELIEFLQKAGVNIVEKENNLLEIHEHKTFKNVKYTLGCDLVEVVTFISYSIYTNAPLQLLNVNKKRIENSLSYEIELFKKMGTVFTYRDNILYIQPNFIHNSSFFINVTPFTIFSDSHPFFTLLLTMSARQSTIEENVWEERFSYVNELVKLGGKFILNHNRLTIYPYALKKDNQVLLPLDLRAAATVILAALKIQGKTIIKGCTHLDRGYDGFLKKLINLGCDIVEYEEEQQRA
jgi:UDP-N-acetylglucosamine 1-carboxyvinyltransferase